jgi:hypothetical protein
MYGRNSSKEIFHLINIVPNTHRRFIMKKILGIVLASCISTAIAFSEATPYRVGDQNVSGGIGFGLAGQYGTASLPPLCVSYETALQALEGKLSVGGLVGIAGSSQDYTYSYPNLIGTFPNYSYETVTNTWKYKYTYIIIGARGAYHLPLVEKVDTYGGLMLGYNIVSSSVEGAAYGNASASASYMAFGAFVGGRYYFNPRWGVYAELGYGIGFLNIGATYKL